MVEFLCAHDFTPDSQDSILRFFYIHPSVHSAVSCGHRHKYSQIADIMTCA